MSYPAVNVSRCVLNLRAAPPARTRPTGFTNLPKIAPAEGKPTTLLPIDIGYGRCVRPRINATEPSKTQRSRIKPPRNPRKTTQKPNCIRRNVMFSRLLVDVVGSAHRGAHVAARREEGKKTDLISPTRGLPDWLTSTRIQPSWIFFTYHFQCVGNRDLVDFFPPGSCLLLVLFCH